MDELPPPPARLTPARLDETGCACYLDDDRHPPLHELAIYIDDQDDAYVMVRPVGHRIGPSVRLCASGGASAVAPGLLPAIRQAYRAIVEAATGASSPGCAPGDFLRRLLKQDSDAAFHLERQVRHCIAVLSSSGHGKDDHVGCPVCSIAAQLEELLHEGQTDHCSNDVCPVCNPTKRAEMAEEEAGRLRRLLSEQVERAALAEALVHSNAQRALELREALEDIYTQTAPVGGWYRGKHGEEIDSLLQSTPSEIPPTSVDVGRMAQEMELGRACIEHEVGQRLSGYLSHLVRTMVSTYGAASGSAREAVADYDRVWERAEAARVRMASLLRPLADAETDKRK